MLKFTLVTLLYLITYLSCHAQIEKTRSINVYNVVVKTSNGKVKGILKQATDTTIIIGQSRETRVIPINTIKSLKIKFAHQSSFKFYDNITQGGIGIITNQGKDTQARNNYGEPIFTPLESTDHTLAEMGTNILVGSAIIATALVSNELTKLIYKPSIEVFKIKKDYKKYNAVKEQIQMYTTYLQQLPEYETIQLEQLKKAMEIHKVNK